MVALEWNLSRHGKVTSQALVFLPDGMLTSA